MKRAKPTDPPIPTQPGWPRRWEELTGVPAVARLCMQLRRSLELASPGTSPASAVPSVAKAWSPPPWQTKTGRSTAKVVTPRTSVPRALALARALGHWSTRSELQARLSCASHLPHAAASASLSPSYHCFAAPAPPPLPQCSLEPGGPSTVPVGSCWGGWHTGALPPTAVRLRCQVLLCAACPTGRVLSRDSEQAIKHQRHQSLPRPGPATVYLLSGAEEGHWVPRAGARR